MREKLEKLQSLRNVVQAVSALRPEKGEDGESSGRTTLLVTEHPRAALDAVMLLAAAPILRKAPMGDGHGVLVLPGMLTGDGFTRPMRVSSPIGAIPCAAGTSAAMSAPRARCCVSCRGRWRHSRRKRAAR